MSTFDENTYKRLKVIKKIDLSFSDTILEYLEKLPPIRFKNQPYSFKIQHAPTDALDDSRFSRFPSILNAVKLLTTKYTLDIPPHKIIIYGNSKPDGNNGNSKRDLALSPNGNNGTNVSNKYINHVANIVRWWATIMPGKYLVTLYLTDIKKRLPPVYPNKPKILSEEYSNSGFTFVAEPRDIHIFRKEESLKVLIHELIHSSQFDFDNKFLHPLPLKIKDDNITNEGITEYLAIIFYYWYIANYTQHVFYPNTSANELFLNYLGNDLGWQEYQMNKILNYFNMKPTDLLIENNFRQKTSIISYFFFKNYLFNENSLPIILSRNYDDINSLIDGMSDFIKSYKTNAVPHSSLSMRMSLYELNY